VHTPQGGSGDERNPAPDMVNIPLFTGFYTSQVVVWGFFHQYHTFQREFFSGGSWTSM